jgi:1,4-alpha-glucan branching enzyme
MKIQRPSGHLGCGASMIISLIIPLSVFGKAFLVADPTNTVEFSLIAPTAKIVSLAGDFNNWNAASLPLHETNGEWRTRVQLNQGRHQYQFVVDGKWIADPDNPNRQDNATGPKNSVVVVGPVDPSEKPDRPIETPTSRVFNVEFTLNAPSANAVSLVGDFNNWSSTASPMQKRPNGEWAVMLQMPLGRHEYKFVVDGREQSDPQNPEQVDDGKGGRKSVLTIGQ